MYPHLYNRFQSLRKYCPFDGINCRKGWKHNTKLSCIESDFLFASFLKLGIRYDRPCILEMKYLFASDCYSKKKKKNNMAGQRDLKERVRLIVYSSTFFFWLQECTRFGVPLARSSTHWTSAKLFFKHNEQLSDLSDLRSS